MSGLPNGLISYGPNANCTLAVCPVEASIYGYRPSIPANVTFLVLFAVAMGIHVLQGIRYRSWWYMSCMVLGCISEIIGYGGRIGLYINPFSFSDFLMQIITITFAPVFFCASIYVVLGKSINYLDLGLARFQPKLLAWIFISCDILSLILQSAGGAMASISLGSNSAGVDTSLVGLCLQVATLTIFLALAADYAIRFARKHRQTGDEAWTLATQMKFKIFAGFTLVSIILILIRCAYRIDELSNGYSGTTFQNEGLFIGLEGAMIIASVFALNIGHPGPVFFARRSRDPMAEKQLSPQTSLESSPERSAIPVDQRK